MSFVGDIVGGLLGMEAADESADAQVEAARIAADQSKFRPFDVTTPFGSSQFDERNQTAGVTLSPEIQQQIQDVGLFTQGFQNQLQGFNPQQFAQNYYNDLRGLSSDTERRQRQQLEDRLFSQGQLGTTGGAIRSEAFEKALALKDLAREFQAEQAARSEQDRLFTNFLTSLGTQNELRRLPLSTLELGGQFGGRAAQAGSAAARFPFLAAQNAADANAAAFQQLSGGVGDAAQAVFDNIFTPSAPDPTTEFGTRAALGLPIGGGSGGTFF